MSLLTDGEIAELKAVQLEACDMTCTVQRHTTTRDTSGGMTLTWADLAGATLVPCRTGQGGASSGGISGARDEVVVGDYEVAAGELACTIITDIDIIEKDRVLIWPSVPPGTTVPSGLDPIIYEVSQVKLPSSYRLAVRVGLNYTR